MQIWATLEAAALFSDYRIESHNNNEITVEVSAESLARVLRSAAGALEVMIRLGKRDRDPLLSFSITMTSYSGAKLNVSQELLIRILRTQELSLIAEPMCPTPDVCSTMYTDTDQVYVVMPPLAEVKSVAEQMRSLSNQVCLGANHSGAFKLAVIDPEVVGDAIWTGLEHPHVSNQSAEQLPPATRQAWQEVSLNMRAFQNVLGCAPLAKSTVACICTNYCIVFYVYLNGQSHKPLHRTNGSSGPGVLNVRSSPILI